MHCSRKLVLSGKRMNFTCKVDTLRLFVIAVLIVGQVLRTGFARLLFEKAHQMTGVGKVEVIGQLAYTAVGK